MRKTDDSNEETGSGAQDSTQSAAPFLIDIDLSPSELNLELDQERAQEPYGQRPLWHMVKPGVRTEVTVKSTDTVVRVVRLSVSSGAVGWGNRWARWSYPVRRTPKDHGGDALVAQDELDTNESWLILLVLPGEARHATVEFEASLDGYTWPGDYPFIVKVEELDTHRSAECAGLLRLKHRKSSMLNSLPAIYQAQSETSTTSTGELTFFERYLRGFEDAGEPMRDLLANISTMFDADSTAEEFISWLSTWVSLALDENWPQLKRRRLIKEMVELYRWRGTRRGLSRYLELYAGVTPEINDQPFIGMRLGPGARLGSETTLGDVPPHTFVVTLSVPDRRRVNDQIVREIIDAGKPAHTTYALRIVESSLQEAV